MGAPQLRVVVVDDDRPLVELLCRSLQRRGISAAAATSLADARASAGEEQQPRIVVDLSAIGDASPEDLDWLRRQRPVVLTGASPAHGKEIAEKIDASAYLEKPVEIGELIGALAQSRPELD